MKILKRIRGVGIVFDTENIESAIPSDEKPDVKKSLHLNHKTTDYEFLREFYPVFHPIFIEFGKSFYYVV